MDLEKDLGKVLSPEIDHEIDRCKNCKIDQDKDLGTDLRFFGKVKKNGQKRFFF